MRKRAAVLCIGLGTLTGAAGTSLAADTHVIVATDAFQWSYNGQQSKLITVDDLKIGDILDIQVPKTLKHKHGFITIDLGPPITQSEDPVLKCGEAGGPKEKTAVLKEDCAPGAMSQFGNPFIGSMKLIVTDKFKKDVSFWCVIHTNIMRGILKLQAAKPK